MSTGAGVTITVPVVAAFRVLRPRPHLGAQHSAGRGRVTGEQLESLTLEADSSSAGRSALASHKRAVGYV
jgi:hypothetical protein